MKRDKAIEAVKELPKEFELEALIERLVFVEKVEHGLMQLKRGKTIFPRKSKGNSEKMVKIIWTEFAIEDLRLIHEYISKDSKRSQIDLLKSLLKELINMKRSQRPGELFQNLRCKQYVN
jgi:hypothetical protein